MTLGDDHAPAVRIDALEMFVDLLARVEEDGSSEEFYGRLCEAACSLTSMERAVLFRYDETQRRVRAAGSHNIPLDVFAGTHLTVETAPIAREALVEDRVLDVVESLDLELPERYRSLLRDGLLVCTPIAASGRWTGVILSDRPGSTPLTDSERYLLWTIGKVAALATHARIATRNQELAKQLQERIDLAREIHDARHPAAVRRVDGVLGRPGADRRGARAHPRGAQRRAEGPADRARAAAGADGAADADDVRGGVRPARRRASGARPVAGRDAAGAGGGRAARAVGADRGGAQREQARRPDARSTCRWSGSTTPS